MPEFRDVIPGSQVSVSQPSLAGLQAALAAGTLSSAALTGFYLQRIERLNPALHAVITVNPDAPAEAGASDAARAATGPFGTTVAHGFLTLSLLSRLFAEAVSFGDVRMSLNYGLNRVRFPSPVPVGSRLRAVCVLQAYEAIDGGAQVTAAITIEREGGAKPACVAEWVTRHLV